MHPESGFLMSKTVPAATISGLQLAGNCLHDQTAVIITVTTPQWFKLEAAAAISMLRTGRTARPVSYFQKLLFACMHASTCHVHCGPGTCSR